MSPNLTITCSPEHEYTVDGMLWPGVTTVIGTVIHAEARRIGEEAASHGTLVRGLAALVVQGIPAVPMGDEGPTQAQIGAFVDWYEEYVEEVHAVELMVAHPSYRYAGTLDLLVRFKGDKRPTVVDLATRQALYPEMKLQTAAYREAALPLLSDYGYDGYARKDCRRGVLHVPREATGPAVFDEHRKHVPDFSAFVCTLNVYRWLRSA